MAQVLGKGASAQVYAVQRVTQGLDTGGRELATKILDLRPSAGSGGEDFARQIDRMKRHEVVKEIELLKHLGGSESCACLLDHSVESPFAYLVMERASCTLLYHFERNLQLTELSYARVFHQMLQGLEHAHSVGIVHRDVKPDNFLCFGPEDRVKLCDFGLADFIPAKSAKQLDGIFGTAPFMAPEMLGRAQYGPKADVWSLAVIAYVVLFGGFPYHPLERNSRAMKAAILAGVPAPKFKPRAVSGSAAPVISEIARSFVQTLLVRDPKMRPDASAALQHPWLVQAMQATQEQRPSGPSLRSMLYAAKREGAFDVRQDRIESEWTPIDKELSELQELAHREQCVFARPHVSEKPFVSGSTHAGSSEVTKVRSSTVSAAASSFEVSETSKFLRAPNAMPQAEPLEAAEPSNEGQRSKRRDHRTFSDIVPRPASPRARADSAAGLGDGRRKSLS